MISTPKPRLSLFKLYESPESGESLLLLLLSFFFREAGYLVLDGKEFGEGEIGSRILLILRVFLLIVRVSLYFNRGNYCKVWKLFKFESKRRCIQFNLSLFHPKNLNNILKTKPAHQPPIISSSLLIIPNSLIPALLNRNHQNRSFLVSSRCIYTIFKFHLINNIRILSLFYFLIEIE